MVTTSDNSLKTKAKVLYANSQNARNMKKPFSDHFSEHATYVYGTSHRRTLFLKYITKVDSPTNSSDYKWLDDNL